MRKVSFLLCLGLVFAAGGGCRLADEAPDIEVGKKLYAEHCAGCHGENGIGQDQKSRGGGRDSNGVLIAPALNGMAHSWHHSPEYLYKYIRKGSPVRDSPMPSFGKELNKQDALSIIAYFQSLWPEPIKKMYFKKYK